MIDEWFNQERQKDLVNFSKKLIPLGREIAIKTGEYFEGDPANHLYVIKKGSLDKLLFDRNGKEIALFRLIRYNLYGEMELMQGCKIGTMLQAVENSIIVEIGGEELAKILDDPYSLRQLFQSATRKYRLLLVELGDARFNDFKGRFAHFLIRMAYNASPKNEAVKQGEPIQLKFTHEQLARRMRVDRSTVSLVVSDFKRSGLIAIDKQITTILDMDGLRALTDFNLED